jgi:hypothetical protein
MTLEINEATLSFTTTAMPRPEVVATTYGSFARNLLGFDLKKARLYLNIDRFPGDSDETKRSQVADIARRYFGEVIVNCPTESSFPAAVQWCFSQVDQPFNFHLEDDWELIAPIRLSQLARLFLAPHVQQVALRSRPNVRQDFWLCPAISRGAFCREVARKMDLSENPEVDIRNIKNAEKRWPKSSFIYFPFDYQDIVVRDLGRAWIKASGFERGATHFTSWSVRP